MKTVKRVICMLLMCCLVAEMFPATSYASDIKQKSIEIGDYIELGVYLGKPIVWRCVAKDNNGPLMLSDKVLCLKAYDAKGDSSTHYVPGFFDDIRKQYGSNCWKDSNLREWLNSKDKLVAWTHDKPDSSNVYKGYNAYDTEAGFMTNFTDSEIGCIKTITHKVYTNEAESVRGVIDGGNSEYVIGNGTVISRSSDLTDKYYQNVTDSFFLPDITHLKALCNNVGEEYLKAYPTQEAVNTSDFQHSDFNIDQGCPYWIAHTETTGYSYEHGKAITADGLVGTTDAWGTRQGGSYLGNIGVRPAFYLNETRYNSTESESKDKIAVFSTEKSLTVKTGDSMWLGFGKIADGKIVGDWKRMAIAVSDPTVISLSEYEETEYGYSLEVTGKKQGATNVTITDTETGSHTVIVISVQDAYVKTYSYAIDNMKTFCPDNKWERSIQTNIYNLNGLYVNNYQESKTKDGYKVSFDIYNSQYHTGAVDIYDADGNWMDCEEIKKFSMISSLWDTGEQTYYLISDIDNGKLLTYEQATFAKHTPVSIKVPDGGYFTISNNFAESQGTYLFNSCEILFEGTCTLIDAAIDLDNDKTTSLSTFSNLIKNEITKDKTTREKFRDVFKKTLKKEAKQYVKKFGVNEIENNYSQISGLFENLLNSLNISWKHLFKSATGVAETAFTIFAGPAGVALKGCFAIAKGGNQLSQAVDLAASIDAPYATVFSSISEGKINSNGVIVNTNGNVDAEAVLQVFKVSNDNTIEVFLDRNRDPLQKYELYNICFVKNDQLVQPTGKVTVRIPIPDGMKGDTCNVYRQESNGTWTILTAHVDGNYLAFDTDHFSLYCIAGDPNELSISSLPIKTTYNVGDILNPDGLVLSLGHDLVADGFVCEPTVLDQAGSQDITVRYGVASTKFSVSVQTNSDDDSSSGGSTGTSTGGASSSSASSGNSTSTSSNRIADVPVAPSDPDEPVISNFTDVSPDTWYYEAVQYVAKHSLMNGYGDGKFGPNDNVTRAQFAQIIYNKEGKSARTTINNFTDVENGAWYYDAVTWTADNKIVSGYGNGLFGPNDDITREQLAVMLWRYAGKPKTSGSLEQFEDAPKASAYAVNALIWAVENGIVNGKDKCVLDPQGKATRAEAAAMLMRYCEKCN